MRPDISFAYPNSRPDSSPDELWNLQCKLDLYAQWLLGERSEHKRLDPPAFVVGGPNVRNLPGLDGGYAELGENAADNWLLTIYQLAHETVHLLDPRPAPPYAKGANWLEEGIAVEFSLLVSREIGDPAMKVNLDEYKKARQLVSRLGGDLFAKVKKIREKCGHISDATKEELIAVVPACPPHIAEKLVSPFSNM
jgi:hypothetical protein